MRCSTGDHVEEGQDQRTSAPAGTNTRECADSSALSPAHNKLFHESIAPPLPAALSSDRVSARTAKSSDAATRSATGYRSRLGGWRGALRLFIRTQQEPPSHRACLLDRWGCWCERHHQLGAGGRALATDEVGSNTAGHCRKKNWHGICCAPLRSWQRAAPRAQRRIPNTIVVP